MHDLYPGNRYVGDIRLHPDNTNLLAKGGRSDRGPDAHQHGLPEAEPVPEIDLRETSVRLRVRGERNRRMIDDKVEQALRGAALWEEVKDRLDELAFNLSGGQQAAPVASRARSPPIRRVRCSTSRPRRSTRSRPGASRS